MGAVAPDQNSAACVLRKKLVHPSVKESFYTRYVRLLCRNALQLLVKRADAPLTLADNLRLRWHLRLCDPCARFSRQVRLLDKLLTRNTANGHVHAAPTLRPERRTQMADEIKND